MSTDPVKVEVFLDDSPEPLATLRPPATFELDTTKIEDGPHRLRIRAIDKSGIPGIRTIDFTVRNGPGIAIEGIRPGDMVEGKIAVLINAYAGGHEDNFEPGRAETPAPVPTWAWVFFLGIVAWAMWYAASAWRPDPRFANTPTYGRITSPAAPGAIPSGPAPSSSTNSALGAQIYGNNCATCHQPEGTGVPGAFPPLKGDPVVLSADPAEHIRVILQGVHDKEIGGTKYAAPMPSFAGQLKDEEIAAVASHERTSWGNQAPIVTAAAVAKIRAEK